MLAGIVEGFFSAPLPPWTFSERRELLDFMSRFTPALNAYFYCPKDDPRVRTHWDTLYPPAEAAPLADFIADCRRRGLNFVYGFNPALPDGADASALTSWAEVIYRKARQLRQLDADLLCLLFDDVPLSYDAVEKRLENADQQAEAFLRCAEAGLAAARRAGFEAWLCTPDYSFYRASSLTRALRSLSGVPLVWTGRGVFVPGVSAADLAAAKANLGGAARLVYWSNYPVNDVEQNVSVLNLGGFAAPPAEIHSAVEGIFVNPMRQCFANLPFLLTFAAYLREPERYDRAEQWAAALDDILGSRLAPLTPLIDRFSACSVVDAEPKFFFQELAAGHEPALLARSVKEALHAAGEAPAISPPARRFLHDIERVLAEARRFADFAEKAAEGEKISTVEFRRGDSFPTVPTEARNVKEVVAIASIRIAAIAGRLPGNGERFEPLLAAASEFGERYQGRERLNISRDDETRYLEVIRRAIELEQEQMLDILNDARQEPRLRLQAYAMRQSINRFTVNAAWVRTRIERKAPLRNITDSGNRGAASSSA